MKPAPAHPVSLRRKIALGAIALVGALLLLLLLLGSAVAYAFAKLTFPDAQRPKLQASKDPAVIERGRYLGHGPAHCASCHSTPERAHPEKVATAPLSGGLEFDMGPTYRERGGG